MYRHELFKIFQRKSIYVVLFFMIVLMVYASSYQDEVMNGNTYEEMFERVGGPITEEKAAYVREKMRAEDERADQGPNSLTSEQLAESMVHYWVAVAGSNSEGLQERKNVLKNTLANTSPKSYENKKAEKELSMLEKLGEPFGYYVIQAWRGMIHIIEPFFTVIFLAILILICITPVFSEEYSNRTIGLMLATKHGKKRIVTAKVLAAFTYIAVVFVFLHLVNLLIEWYVHGGFKGWNAPIQSLPDDVITVTNYVESPFAWKLWQLYGITLTTQFVACIAFSILVICLSILVRNSMITFLTSGFILGLPFLFRQLGLDEGIFYYFNTFSYLEFMRVERLYEQFSVYNLFGAPVLYPTLIFIVFIIISVIVLLFSYNRFSRQQVNT